MPPFDTGSGMTLSPTQKGRIAEMIVGAAIMHASDGRLAPFVPLADDDGLDLIRFDKLTGVTTPIRFKARRKVCLGSEQTTQATSAMSASAPQADINLRVL